MSRLWPLRSEPDLDEREPALVELDDDHADEVFDALGSKTARTLLTALHEEPRPALELTPVVETTVQNVQYHLTKLQAADLIERVDTWYGENGTEMAVYAPTDEALVIVAGEDTTGSLRRLVERLVGAAVPVAVGVAALWWWLGDRAEMPTAGYRSENMTVPTMAADSTSAPDPLLLAVVLCVGGILALCGYGVVKHVQGSR